MKKIICSQYIWIILGMFVVCYFGIMNVLFRLSGYTLFKFFIMNICSIMIPGAVMVDLLKMRLSKLTKFSLAYILGYALVVVEYFICSLFGGYKVFGICSLIIFVCSVLYFAIKIKRKNIKTSSYELEHISNIVGLFFLAIIAFISLFVYSANYLGIEAIPVVNLFQDMGFWCSNTAALKLHYPAYRLWAYGESLNYHYFSSIPIAFLSHIYDIDVYTMSFQLYSLTKTILLIGSVQFLLDSYDARKGIRIVSYIALLLTTGLEYMVNVTFIYYLYYRPFGFDYGYAYGILFIGALISQWKEKRINVGKVILAFISWAMCVGGKGPIAAILIVFAGMICLYWLFAKNLKCSLIYGIGILSIFVIISYFCTGMFAINSGQSGSYYISLNSPFDNKVLIIISVLFLVSFTFIVIFRKKIKDYIISNKKIVLTIVTILFVVGLIKRLVSSMNDYHTIELTDHDSTAPFVSSIVNYTQNHPFLENVICLLFTNPFLIIGMLFSFVISIVWYVNNKIRGNELWLQLSLFLSSVIGLALGIVLNVVGHSEMYFSMAAFIPMTCIIIEMLNHIEKQEIYVQKWVKKVISVALVLFMIVGLYNSNFLYWKSDSLLYWSKRGYEIVRGSFSDVDYYSDGVFDGIRDTDVEALRWVRDNTDTSDMLMVDKGNLTEIGQYYLYGVFSERQTYYEQVGDLPAINNSNITRHQLMVRVYNNDYEALLIAKEEGIDYIVQTLDVTPQFVYDETALELMYSTETMNIYKIK